MVRENPSSTDEGEVKGGNGSDGGKRKRIEYVPSLSHLTRVFVKRKIIDFMQIVA